MKIGDKVKLKNNDESTDQKLWKVLGFYEACGVDFVKLKHPTIRGVFSFPKSTVLEVVCE